MRRRSFTCATTLFLSLCLAEGGLLGSSTVLAVTLHYEFEGIVTELTGNTGAFGMPTFVKVGQKFSGRFSYEVGAGNPDQEPGDSQQGVYDLLTFEIDQSVVPIAPTRIGIFHRPGLPTLPPQPPDPGIDGVNVAGTWFDGLEDRVLALLLVADFGTVFNDDSLPTNLALADFPEQHRVRAIRALGVLPNPNTEDIGQLTSLTLVPEPATATLGLFVLALAGLGVVRRRT